MYGRQLIQNLVRILAVWKETGFSLLALPPLPPPYKGGGRSGTSVPPLCKGRLGGVERSGLAEDCGRRAKTLDSRFCGNDRKGNAGIRLFVMLAVCSVLTGFLSSQVLADEDHQERTEEEPLEKIWDHELNRWLTPEELGHLEIYFTEDEAAKIMFPDSEKIRRETLTLTADQKSFVERVIGWEFPETSFDVFIGETQESIDGYAVIQNTIGKHRPITYMVAVDSAGEVTNFEVLVYREARGNEIATKRFNYQYQGKTVEDPVRINRDIINITGATMSVRSASAGVKRVLVLVNEFYLKPRGLGTNVMIASKSEKGFFETLLGL